MIIPPAGRPVDIGNVRSPTDGPSEELAALEAGWDELLLA